MEAYEMLELCREALARDSQDPSALAMMKWLSDSKLPTSDYVTVPANSPTAGCEACGYKFLFASSTKCPSCGDPREAIVADGYDFLTANTVPIMDSTVGLKAANAHLTRRVAELEAENIELHDARRAIAIDAKARIETLESQLAMRVTPATQPTNAQQTASDVKAMQEPKAFPAGALKVGGSDPRRMGP